MDDDLFYEMEDALKNAVSVRSTRSWVKIPDEEDPQRLVWQWVPVADDDLDALFRRVDGGNSSDEDHELFDACMLDRFIGRVETGKPVEPWILASLAKAFTNVLMGAKWNDEIRLPGRPTTQIWTWREQRDFEIYSDAVHDVKSKGLTVVQAIEIAAQ